jgi:hypothetical protein
MLPAEPNGVNVLLEDIFRDKARWHNKMFHSTGQIGYGMENQIWAFKDKEGSSHNEEPNVTKYART